jgi:hypothetical protein
MKTHTNIAIIATTVILLLSLLVAASDADPESGTCGSLPSSHMIAVPWHQQMNGLFCGEGVLEVIYDYWGPDIDQKQIANVARSSSAGTWSSDMVRAGHFSNTSSAQGRFFPNAVPTAGYPERGLGYASFSYSSDKFWLDGLKALIAADVPVILLMTFEPDGGGGHYRTAIGYNDTIGKVYFSDPWGRDQNHQTNWTGITVWSYQGLQSGWNYTAEGEDHPNWGMIMMPWQINIKTSGEFNPGTTVTINAEISYPCPKLFDSSLFPSKDTKAVIALPEGMRLVSGSNTILLGEMRAGSSKKASWKAAIDQPVTGKEVEVTAYGILSGHVPEARWTGEQKSYPPYDYSDAIGGEMVLTL